MIRSSVVFLSESGRTHWSWQTTNILLLCSPLSLPRNFLRHFNQTISCVTADSCFVCCRDACAARRWCTVTPWPVAPLDKRPPPVAAARTNLTPACAFCCYGNRSKALSTTNCKNYWSAEHFSFVRHFLSLSDGGWGVWGKGGGVIGSMLRVTTVHVWAGVLMSYYGPFVRRQMASRERKSWADVRTWVLEYVQ